MRSGYPVVPSELPELKAAQIPGNVYDAFNELIVKNWNGRYSSFKQNDVVDIIAREGKIPRNVIFDNHYLDVEDAYRAAGWEVEYDRPAYNETFPATFTFRKKSN